MTVIKLLAGVPWEKGYDPKVWSGVPMTNVEWLWYMLHIDICHPILGQAARTS